MVGSTPSLHTCVFVCVFVPVWRGEGTSWIALPPSPTAKGGEGHEGDGSEGMGSRFPIPKDGDRDSPSFQGRTKTDDGWEGGEPTPGSNRKERERDLGWEREDDRVQPGDLPQGSSRRRTKETRMVRVYWDLIQDGEALGRMVFDLFDETWPQMCENVRALCTGEKGNHPKTKNELTYRGTVVDRTVPGKVMEVGKFENTDTGSESVFGDPFHVEPGERKHNTSGLLSTIPDEQGRCGSRFAITLGKCEDRDGRCVVFGTIVRGYGVLREIESFPTNADGCPVPHVVVSRCGELEPNDYGLVSDDDGDPYSTWPQDHPNMSSQHFANRLAAAAFIKQLGNTFYAQKRYEDALRKYGKGMRYLDKKFLGTAEYIAQEKEEKRIQAESRIPLLLNIAACNLCLGRHRAAVQACSDAHRIMADVNDARIKPEWRLKLFRRRADGYLRCREFESAIRDLGMCLKINPDSARDREALDRAKKLLHTKKAAEKNAFQKAFAGGEIF